ncbi:MAG TPA: CAP domain-containing protein [Chloroflexota bacterium]|nr:CAP domain-containing protein [Chloroflexota bacterium]
MLRLAIPIIWLLASAWHPTPAAAGQTQADGASRQATESRATSAFLAQLLDEINVRREQIGSPPVGYASDQANAAASQYLADLTPLMLALARCFHGDGSSVRPGWDYVSDTGFRGEGRGEVLACPGRDGYWTAARVADGWWSSPLHRQILYADAAINTVACGTYGPQLGGAAFQTVVCVTYRS